jgi:hypothetical protein
MRTAGSIMIAGLEEIDPILANQIDDPVLLGQPS